jgi:glutaredoxin
MKMKIKLYTLTTCHDCTELKRQLQEEGLDFSELTRYEEVLKVARERHLSRVPFAVIEVDGEIKVAEGLENIVDLIQNNRRGSSE